MLGEHETYHRKQTHVLRLTRPYPVAGTQDNLLWSCFHDKGCCMQGCKSATLHCSAPDSLQRIGIDAVSVRVQSHDWPLCSMYQGRFEDQFCRLLRLHSLGPCQHRYRFDPLMLASACNRAVDVGKQRTHWGCRAYLPLHMLA